MADVQATRRPCLKGTGKLETVLITTESTACSVVGVYFIFIDFVLTDKNTQMSTTGTTTNQRGTGVVAPNQVVQPHRSSVRSFVRSLVILFLPLSEPPTPFLLPNWKKLVLASSWREKTQPGFANNTSTSIPTAFFGIKIPNSHSAVLTARECVKEEEDLLYVQDLLEFVCQNRLNPRGEHTP